MGCLEKCNFLTLQIDFVDLQSGVKYPRLNLYNDKHEEYIIVTSAVNELFHSSVMRVKHCNAKYVTYEHLFLHHFQSQADVVSYCTYIIIIIYISMNIYFIHIRTYTWYYVLPKD